VTARHNLPDTQSHIRFLDNKNVTKPIEVELRESASGTRRIGQVFGAPLDCLTVQYDLPTDMAYIHVDKSNLWETLGKVPLESELLRGEIEFNTWGFFNGFPNSLTSQKINGVVDNVDHERRTFQRVIDMEALHQHSIQTAVFDDPNSYADLVFERALTEHEVFFSREGDKAHNSFKGYSGGPIFKLSEIRIPDGKLFDPADYIRMVGIQTDVSNDSREKHFIRGSKIDFLLELIDKYLDDA